MRPAVSYQARRVASISPFHPREPSHAGAAYFVGCQTFSRSSEYCLRTPLVAEDVFGRLENLFAAEDQRRADAGQIDCEKLALGIANQLDQMDQIADRRAVHAAHHAERRDRVAFRRLVRQPDRSPR